MGKKESGKRNSIGRKIKRALIGTGLLVPLLLIVIVGVQKLWLWVGLYESIKNESEESQKEAQELFDKTEEAMMNSYSNVSLRYFDEYFMDIRKQTRAIANLMKKEISEEEIRLLMKQMELYEKAHPKWLILYIAKEDGEVVVGSREKVSIEGLPDLRKEKWYKKAKKRFVLHKKRKFYWTNRQASLLSGENDKVICAYPISNKNREFAGVVAASIDVACFQERLDYYDSDERTAIAILDRNGVRIGSSEGYKDIGDKAKKTGETYGQMEGIRYKISQMQETKWTICLQRSREEQIKAEKKFRLSFEDFINDIKLDITVSNFLGLMAMVFLVCFGVIIMIHVANRLSESLTRPITRMVAQVESFGEDNDFVEVDVESDDEIGQLGMAFNRMAAKLRDYLDHIRIITAENERMESERSLVRQIQQNMLPNEFPAFPNRKELDIYASLLPATEGGGSFYDFFFIDKMTFCISVGEATGHGLLSTMFALAAKTVIKSYALQGYGTDRILAEANNQIAYGNNEGIIADAFVGIIRLSSGEMEYSIAGEAPVQWKHSGEAPRALPELSGVTLGNMENIPYQKKHIRLSQGDLLFAYTKDTPECVDAHGSIYTAEYLHEKLADLSANDYKITSLVNSLNEDIEAYTAGTKRRDDVTMLMFRFWG
ncbi:MAG: SpoIIE family protein phosphatase [Lachnospiraceae bacterium]|nr:SpoIIE family protein phosphatase [Lachnospiraceae bacterium]